MPKHNWKIQLFAVLAIIACASLVYSNSLHGEFHLDDTTIIGFVADKSIQSVKSVILQCRSGRPILNFSFALNYLFSKFDTFGYYLTNLIIHILTAILAFFVIELTLKLPLLKERFGEYASTLALLASLIFVVHPLHATVQRFITARSESLASLFYLATLLFFILLVQHPGYKILCCLGGAICAFLAVGTKEIAATAPILILIYDFMLVSGKNLKELKKRWIFHALMFLPLLLLFYYIPIKMNYDKQVGSGSSGVTALNYLFTQFTVVLYYIKLIFLPFPLNINADQPFAKGLFEFPTFLSFLVLIGIFVLAGKLFKRQPLYAFLIIWYFLIISPSSSIVPIATAYWEYRVYLASLGVIWLCLLGIVPCLRSKTIFLRVLPLRYLCVILVGLIIPIFGWMTFQRNFVWQTEISLWEDAVCKSPNLPRTHLYLARAYRNAGLLGKAMIEYYETLRIDPLYRFGGIAEEELGFLYYKLGKINQAFTHLKAARDRIPQFPRVHFNLGVLYEEQGNIFEAIQCYRKAIELRPEYFQAYYRLGEIYLSIGRTQEAIEMYKKAISINPELANAHTKLGILYFEQRMRYE